VAGENHLLTTGAPIHHPGAVATMLPFPPREVRGLVWGADRRVTKAGAALGSAGLGRFVRGGAPSERCLSAIAGPPGAGGRRVLSAVQVY
jgi:hypothetical protein